MKIEVLKDPFPHVIIRDLYDENELEAIWDELKFFTRPGKLLPGEQYGSAPGRTNANAVILDQVFTDICFSNIMSLDTKIFSSDALERLGEAHESCAYFNRPGLRLTTKLRYYHHGEVYDTHTDYSYQFLVFSYFHKEPKKYSGGNLFFEKHDYTYGCDNNSCIIIPGYIPHGVGEVSIDDSDYYDGNGRYCISIFAQP